jgi:DNA-binding phage protein
LPPPADLEREVGLLTNNGGLKRREALKQLADRYGMSVNALYKHLSDGS